MNKDKDPPRYKAIDKIGVDDPALDGADDDSYDKSTGE